MIPVEDDPFRAISIGRIVDDEILRALGPTVGVVVDGNGRVIDLVRRPYGEEEEAG